MQNFLLSFNVVFPIAIMMALGYFLRHIKLLSEATVKQVNNSIFKVFLPIMLFKNVYETEISEVFDVKLALFATVCIIAAILIIAFTVPIFEKQNSRRGVLIQAMFRSNFVIFGIPITEALCGKEATGIASVLIAIVVPLFNFAAVITLEIFNGSKPNFLKILKGIIKNPLIVASLTALLVNFTGIRFPGVIETSMSSIASIATPLALIILGASINFSTVSKNALAISLGLAVKLIILPAVTLSLAVFAFGFRGAEVSIIMAIFASPTAVSSFTMAEQMGGDGDLACQLVMFSTVASVLSMFLWVFTLVQFGFI